MASYAYLCKKAGLPAPTGFAVIDRTPRPDRPLAPSHAAVMRRITKEARAKAWLASEMDAMVARGELYKDEQGRYGLPEWREKS